MPPGVCRSYKGGGTGDSQALFFYATCFLCLFSGNLAVMEVEHEP